MKVVPVGYKENIIRAHVVDINNVFVVTYKGKPNGFIMADKYTCTYGYKEICFENFTLRNSRGPDKLTFERLIEKLYSWGYEVYAFASMREAMEFCLEAGI